MVLPSKLPVLDWALKELSLYDWSNQTILFKVKLCHNLITGRVERGLKGLCKPNKIDGPSSDMECGLCGCTCTQLSRLECWTEFSGVAWVEEGARPALFLVSGSNNICRGRPSFFMKLFSLLWLTLLSCCPATVDPPMKLYMMLVTICSLLKY